MPSRHRIVIAGGTDVGRKRGRNEDSYGVMSGDDCPKGLDGLLVVADGMGGHAAGDVASQMAVDIFIEKVSTLSKECFEELRTILPGILSEANSKIYSAGLQNQDGLMGTTCTAAILSAGSLIVVNAGDSRGYLFRDGDLSRITRDHSLVAQLLREGQITEQQARVHQIEMLLPGRWESMLICSLT